MEPEDAVATYQLEDVDVPSDSDEPPSGQSPQERFTSRSDEQNAVVMPVSEVSAMLQAMREEQLQTLNRIADGVQQLQSQILVMGETTTATDASMRVCLERLSGLEVRIGSIPVPMKAPDSFQPHNQNTSQFSRGGAVGGGFTPVVGRMDVPRVPAFAASPYAPSSSLPAEVAPPPPPPAPGPARVPSWMDRSIEREPVQPHFMRSASAQPRAGYAKGATAATVSPVSGSIASVTGSTVQASPPAAAAAAASTAEPAVISPEEAAKEAKRKAFIEDRARIQARIAARKASTNAGASSSNNYPAMPVAPSAPPLPEAQQTQPQGGFGGGGSAGMFYGNPGFVGGGLVEEGTGETTAEDRVDWLERERALRERREKERLEAAERERKRREEEEARIQREKAEAKRRKEEEEARLLREAEEARERERKKREMEAKRQAKTRVIMSSLFDTGETGGGSSLFGGLGAALPAGGSVFDDGGGSTTTTTSYNSGGGGGGGEGVSSTAAVSASPVTEGPPEDGAKTAASGAAPVSALAYPIGGSAGGGGSLFAGMDDMVKASRGGLFDGIDTPASPVARRPSPEEAIETRSSSRSGEDSFNPESLGLFDRSPRRDDPASATACAEEAAGPAVIGSGEDQADADDEIDRIFSSDGIEGGGGGYRGGEHDPAEQDDYDYDDEDFLSTTASGRGGVSSATAESAARGVSLFPQDEDEQQDDVDEGDNVFSSPFPGRGGGKDVSTISAAEAAAVVGGDGSGGRGSGTSLFDRAEFSIGGVDDDGGVFGKGSGDGGGGGVSEVEGNGSSAAFLTALGELDLGSQGQGQAAPDRDGMVDVTL